MVVLFTTANPHFKTFSSYALDLGILLDVSHPACQACSSVHLLLCVASETTVHAGQSHSGYLVTVLRISLQFFIGVVS